MADANGIPAIMNGAQAILKMLELHGVQHVFGLPGETTIGWYKEWRTTSNIEYVLTRDERTASFAAEAYAKVTGRPCVLEAPSPGVTHCTPGITEAFLSSVPVIYFSSDIPINQDKKHGLTGVDQTALYASICKESFYITNVKEIPFLLRRAFRVATSGRPAPVHIRVPINVFHETAEITDLYAEPDYQVYPAHRPVADHAKIRKAIGLLLASKKAVIICGQGALISKASEVIQELAELLQIPVGTTTPGKGTIPEDHPLALRVIGARGGMDYANDYVKDTDAVFFVGTNTDSSSTDHWKLYGDPTSKAFLHLDIAEAHVGNNFPVQVALVGDARASLAYMVELIKAEHPRLDRTPVDLNPIKRAALDKVFNSNIPMPKGVVSPVKLTQALDEMLPDNAIVTAEPGVSAIFPSALLTMRKAGRRYLTNYSMGALGYAVPAGIGASFANDGPIISFTGDGSLAFVLGDFETIRRSGKNVTVILTRNDTYGWIRGEAVLLDNVDASWATDFGAVDYMKVAEGFGFRTARISSEDDIRGVLAEAISYEGASFIEIMVPSQDKIIPFVPAWVRVAKERNLPYFS
ncbi:thiamine pyrophosphate-binding protein [Chelatococcus asaccharovorans]|uniref:Acetolactate synthase-1/2/3 large subunit n=1 Tax=Chelatococcus asaccharovorans TaxID=28210 RepID=A0A2V3TXL8_9HYPH|nr:thiamine pyrophosphate-binding protein [Chelatococcus asaccharovorans]MBS7705110.1 thiamine pyrophosphate-binding protein [Chelatococcus asaccharovorans]PXW53602.1 acetolactate synthase-1/2/3 large subunit [Chelatococcus asaccharovorans]